FLRRHCSTRFNLGATPVYLVQCGKDLNEGWSLLEAAFVALEARGQVWGLRIPHLFSSIMLIDTVELAGFYLADRCCCLNPWRVRGYIQNRDSQRDILAGGIVYCLASASLLSRKHGRIGIVRSRDLSLGANVRFLKRCLTRSADTDVQAM